MVIDESYEIPRDLIRGIVDPEKVSHNGTTLTPAQLLKEFQDESSTWFDHRSVVLHGFNDERSRNEKKIPAASKYMVTFMRMITSTQIQGEPETYEPFLTHPDTGETMGVRDFCRIVVEVMGKEAGERKLLLFQVSTRMIHGGGCADILRVFSSLQIMCN